MPTKWQQRPPTTRPACSIPANCAAGLTAQAEAGVGAGDRVGAFGIAAEGALVYTVDTSIADSEYGFKVISGSKKPISRQPFILSDAPLKKGQSVVIEGIKITNVEWGEFGDVIKVEPSTSGK